MRAVFAAEWVKLRHRWMPRVLVLIMLIIISLLFWSLGTNRVDRTDLFMPRGWLVSLIFAAGIAPFLWPIIGASWAGSEYGWGTIRLVLSRRPSRVQFVLAGLIILTLYVGLTLLIVMLFSCIAGSVVALLTGHSAFTGGIFGGSFIATLVKTFLASWYVLLFYMALAYAAGTIFRSGAVGIGVGIGITLAELVITGIFFGLGGPWESIARHFPSVYARTLPVRAASGVLTGAIARTTGAQPGAAESIFWLAIYTAIPVALALVLVRFRDVTA